jgi:hypothetical protein
MESLERVRTMTEHPDEFSREDHAVVADELAAAFEALTKVELVASDQLAPFVVETGITLRRDARHVDRCC